MKEIYAINVYLSTQSLDVSENEEELLLFLLASETCNNCENDGLYYVKFLGFFVLRVGAVVYSIQYNYIMFKQIKFILKDQLNKDFWKEKRKRQKG